MFIKGRGRKPEDRVSGEREMSAAYIAGVAVGVLVGVLLIFVFLKMTKTDGRMKCEYDERQMRARGNGFKYGFFTMLICNLILAFAVMEESFLRMDRSVLMILSIMIGVIVYVSYCIWNDAYFSLNENRRKVLIAFVIIGVFNLVLGIGNLYSGDAFTDGVLNFHSVNLFCGILFLMIFAVLLAKHFMKTEEEDE